MVLRHDGGELAARGEAVRAAVSAALPSERDRKQHLSELAMGERGTMW